MQRHLTLEHKLPLTLPLAATALAVMMASPASASDTVAATPTTAKPKAGADLANDWLREQSAAFDAWDIGGQVRARYETKANAGTFPNADFVARGQVNDDDFLFLRSRVHVGYQPVTWFGAFVEGQDGTAFWDRRSPSPGDDSLDLQQAFLLFGNSKEFPLTLKVGRQELSYGDERFVGRSDWSNTGRVFDAVKLRAEGKAGWVDVFTSHAVVPYDDQLNENNSYDWFSGIYGATRKLVPWQETQVYCLVRDYNAEAPNAIAPGVPGSPRTARDIVTFGTLWKSLLGKLGGWDYSFEAAGQLGSVNAGGVRRDQRSYAVFASGGYTWTNAWTTPRLGLGYELGSGDRNPNDGVVETFENVFGTQHRPYGLMDLFGARNMHVPKLSLSGKPAKGLTLSADYLVFIMADTHDSLYPESGSGRNSNGYNIHPGYNSFVGSELDLLASYAIKSWGNVQAGYGHFFVGDYIRQSVNSVPANGGTTGADWFYAQLTFNF